MTCRELQTKGEIAIAGAGPAGAALARLPQMRGMQVKIFERDASPASRSVWRGGNWMLTGPPGAGG